MKLIVGFLIGIIIFPTLGFALDPSYLKIKMYALYVSDSEYCTNPREMFSYSSPDYKDVLGSPDFGSVDNADGVWDGTKKCLIAKISDQIKFAPSTSGGNCTQGQEYTLDVCRTDSNSVSPEGISTSCRVGEDTVYVYISTGSTEGDGGNSFQSPTSSNPQHGVRLSSAWVISGGATGTFIVDGTGKVQNEGSSCGMNPPTMSFR